MQKIGGGGASRLLDLSRACSALAAGHGATSLTRTTRKVSESESFGIEGFRGWLETVTSEFAAESSVSHGVYHVHDFSIARTL
jgi:hypothetical protein